MSTKSYGIVCALTHACEVLEPRWTIPILSEMWCGSTRFNDIRRGVGNISPALLSKRLKELELQGLVERIEDPATGQVDYLRTQRAIDLEPALNALSDWAQCNIEARVALEDSDVSTLMWKMPRYIFTDQLPNRQIVIRFHFNDEGLNYDTYWALIRPGKQIEICSSIPDFDVDLYIETNRVSLSAILLNRSTFAREVDEGRIFLSGDNLLIKTIDRWFYRSKAGEEGQVLQLA